MMARRRSSCGNPFPGDHFIVITGLVPVIPINVARPCQGHRDCRDKPGNDELSTWKSYHILLWQLTKRGMAILTR
jgi:hypothetical protein